MPRRTKIVCTLGPAVDSRDAIKSLIAAGMNVARLNCSHGDWDQKARWVEWIRELSPSIGAIGILADLQGPKFRIGSLPSTGLVLKKGDTVTLGPGGQIPIEQPEIVAALHENARLLFGDGEIEVKVMHGDERPARGRVVTGGALHSRKGVTLIGQMFNVPPYTQKDAEDLKEALRLGVDFVALSYVKSGSDMAHLRDIVATTDKTVGLCAKIETREAIRDLDSIIAQSDIIMVARGDMGLQMDIEDVPPVQKEIIRRCNHASIPVITATQMLESMILNARPTRAEATDIYNAIHDGADAVMLSGETAAGAYPIACVKTMARIAEAADNDLDPARIDREFREQERATASPSVAIAHAAVDIRRLLKTDAIACTTTSGQTPRLVSRFRPRCPILCATLTPRVQRLMSVVWGVEAGIIEPQKSTERAIQLTLNLFKTAKRLKSGDDVVVTAGVPVGEPGNTNLIQLVKTP